MRKNKNNRKPNYSTNDIFSTEIAPQTQSNSSLVPIRRPSALMLGTKGKSEALLNIPLPEKQPSYVKRASAVYSLPIMDLLKSPSNANVSGQKST